MYNLKYLISILNNTILFFPFYSEFFNNFIKNKIYKILKNIKVMHIYFWNISYFFNTEI